MGKHFVKWPQGTAAALQAAGLPDGSPMVVLIEMLTWWHREDNNLLYMSVETIQGVTSYPERTVQRALRAIEKTGLLVRLPGGGTKNNPSQYRVSAGLRKIFDV